MGRVIFSIGVLLLALGWQQPSANANPIMIAKSVIEFSMEAYDNYQKIKAFFDRPPTDDEELSAKDVKMFDMLQDISLKLSDVQYHLMSKIASDKVNDLAQQVEKLWYNVRKVQNVYKGLTELTNEHQNKTVHDFVTTVVKHDGKLSRAVQNMHDILTVEGFGKKTLLSLLSGNQNTNVMCMRGQSIQRIINDLFKMVFITDAQSVILGTFGYEKMEEWQNKPYKVEKAELLKHFNERIDKTYSKVKQAMAEASRELYRCDPESHILGKTYWKLQEIFQAYIESEENRNTCGTTCPTLKGRVQEDCKTDFCKTVLWNREHKRCDGYLTDCKAIDAEMSVCHAFTSPHRRYTYLETSAGKVYGQKQVCNVNGYLLDKLKAHYSLPDVWNKCEHCLCTCISDKIQADRYFSLTDVISDTSNNMVVTGVRFKLQNHVFVIQIQEGRLQANGSIEPHTVNWQPINVTIKDLNLNNFARVDSDEYVHFNGKNMLYPVDSEKNTIYLDDLDIPSAQDEVITGLRFQHVRDALRLEVQRTAFDYVTGTLKSTSKWYFNPEHLGIGKRKIVDLGTPTDPTLVKGNDKASSSNLYVSFRMSDLEKDLGQTTVPFIDIQEVQSNPPSPIAGAGIFHRGGESSGGFIALKLFEFDRSKYM